MSASTIRAVNGAIGSNRSASLTAFFAYRPGSAASSAHWSGCSANSRSACESWLWVVSTPPASRLSTRLMHSSWVSRSPSSSAASSALIRSSPGL